MENNRPLAASPLSQTQKLLVASLVLGVATQVRLGSVGPGEVAAALYLGLSFMGTSAVKATRLSQRVGLLVISIVCAMAIGAGLSSLRNDTAPDKLHDTLGMGLSAAIVLVASRNDFADFEKVKRMFRDVIGWLTAIMGSVLALAQVISNLGPIQFWYGGGTRFRGLCNNPNQITVFFGFMPSATFFLFKGWKRWVLIGLQMAIGLASKSDGFQLAQLVALGGAILAATLGDVLRNQFSGRGALYGVIAVVAAVASYPLVAKLLSERSSEALADGGNGRAELFEIAWARVPHSPIFGYGPGSWVVDRFGQAHEVHNNYADLLLRSGLVGVLALVVFQGAILLNSARRHPALFGSAMSLVAFGLTGFQLRWPVHWFAWVFIGALCLESDASAVDPIPNAEIEAPDLLVAAGLGATR
jgi:hypothetical protein